MVAGISWRAPDGCSYFLVRSGWLLLFPGEIWMVAVTSLWALDGCCYRPIHAALKPLANRSACCIYTPLSM